MSKEHTAFVVYVQHKYVDVVKVMTTIYLYGVDAVVLPIAFMKQWAKCFLRLADSILLTITAKLILVFVAGFYCTLWSVKSPFNSNIFVQNFLCWCIDFVGYELFKYLLMECCWFTPRNNLFLQLLKRTAIYTHNQVRWRNGVTHQFTSSAYEHLNKLSLLCP